jgi:2-oxoglutarate ferredoxin oxidoreductase subunit alpha
VSSIHLRHLNPFPPNLRDLLGAFDQVLVPELNAGQLAMLLRARFLVPAHSLTKIQGQPFKVQEIRDQIDQLLRPREARVQ